MLFQKILVAIDDSSLSSFVFAAALELAQSNKAVMRLHSSLSSDIVSESTPPMMLDVSLPLGLVNTDEYQSFQTQQVLIEKQIEEAKAILKRYCDEAINHGVPTESNYEVGDPGHEICKAAKEWHADLIVVGRRGLTGLTEAILGSVSNYVVHHAPCSVLVIQDVEPEPPLQADTNR
ncbi:MAG TPA: universal stress protein [Coleofasciculaceae cyanobacterium]|jgi:nucleotide-binding universal stress UspA family protein